MMRFRSRFVAGLLLRTGLLLAAVVLFVLALNAPGLAAARILAAAFFAWTVWGLWRHIQRTKDRKSTRLNSSHSSISYAVFCLKKKKKITNNNTNNKRNRTQIH